MWDVGKLTGTTGCYDVPQKGDLQLHSAHWQVAANQLWQQRRHHCRQVVSAHCFGHGSTDMQGLDRPRPSWSARRYEAVENNVFIPVQHASLQLGLQILVQTDFARQTPVTQTAIKAFCKYWRTVPARYSCRLLLRFGKNCYTTMTSVMQAASSMPVLASRLGKTAGCESKEPTRRLLTYEQVVAENSKCSCLMYVLGLRAYPPS
jgi:hypothetical protein